MSSHALSPTQLPYCLIACPAERLRAIAAAVIIPACNEAADIENCLHAVRCQWSSRGQSLQSQILAVVVINGSQDATAMRVLRFARQYPTMPLLALDIQFEEPFAHVGSARKLGFDLASYWLGPDASPATLLFSTDADTRLEESCIDKALSYLHRGADAIGAASIWVCAATRWSTRPACWRMPNCLS